MWPPRIHNARQLCDHKRQIHNKTKLKPRGSKKKKPTKFHRARLALNKEKIGGIEKPNEEEEPHETAYFCKFESHNFSCNLNFDIRFLTTYWWPLPGYFGRFVAKIQADENSFFFSSDKYHTHSVTLDTSGLRCVVLGRKQIMKYLHGGPERFTHEYGLLIFERHLV